MLTVGVLPTLVAVVSVAVILGAGAPGAPMTFSGAVRVFEELGLSGFGLVSLVALVLSVTLQPLQFRLVQLLEGYWDQWWMRPLANFGVWWHRWRRGRLVRRRNIDPTLAPRQKAAARERSANASHLLRSRYPEAARVMPTLLGNVLRSAEDRAGRRYEIRAITTWPRLYHLLPKDFLDRFEAEVDQLDTSARLAVTYAVAGVVVSMILLRDGFPDVHSEWLFVPAGLFLLARLSYRAAVESALQHGQDIEVAIDLFRNTLVTATRLPDPATLRDEQECFKRLNALYRIDNPDAVPEIAYRPGGGDSNSITSGHGPSSRMLVNILRRLCRPYNAQESDRRSAA